MDSKQHEEYFRGLDVILRTYNKAGFVITAIRCDGEDREMMDIVSDELNVEMNYTNAQEHVPEAERNNRTIKETNSLETQFATTIQETPHLQITPPR